MPLAFGDQGEVIRLRLRIAFVLTDDLTTARMLSTQVIPGDKVVVIVHTFPHFNQIKCVRLGDLSFQLDEV